jgi:hypothetical protein
MSNIHCFRAFHSKLAGPNIITAQGRLRQVEPLSGSVPEATPVRSTDGFASKISVLRTGLSNKSERSVTLRRHVGHVHFIVEAVKLAEIKFSAPGETNAESHCDYSNQQGHDQI